MQREVYETLPPDDRGRLISRRLGLALVRWHGIYAGVEATWLRWATLDGTLLLPTPQEALEAETQRAEAETQRAEAETRRAEAEAQRAETETQRADAEKQRADTEARRAAVAEAEIARLRALLASQGDSSINQ